MWWSPTFTASRRTPDAAAGPGTPAPPPGCTASCVESILGFQPRGDRLRIDPCIPKEWKSFTLTYRHRSATYRIHVENLHGVEYGVAEVIVDGQKHEDKDVELADDGRTHEVRIVLG